MSKTKRCPKCETEKPRVDFAANGYCKPCMATYKRNWAARKAAGDEDEGDDEAPAQETAPELEESTPPPTIATIADRVASTSPAHRAVVRIDEASRRRTIARELSEPVLGVLQSGERLTFVVTRLGAAILVDLIDIEVVDS